MAGALLSPPQNQHTCLQLFFHPFLFLKCLHQIKILKRVLNVLNIIALILTTGIAAMFEVFPFFFFFSVAH